VGLNGLTTRGAQGPEIAPVTLPAVKLAEITDAAIKEEARAAASKVAERRTIREGLDCWREIGRAESYGHWVKIGAALFIGKQFALLTIGRDAPWYQRRYGHRFSQWLRAHGFDAMRPSERSDAITLFENRESIERWRATLSDKQRRRLRGAQQNVKRWRRAQQAKPQCDDVATALAAWRKFRSCLAAMSLEQAAVVWQQTVMAEAAALSHVA
jgi:hypothetical protein